jgi:hypothetical protein
LPALEHALSKELIPAKQDIIRGQLTSEVEIIGAQQAMLASRSRNIVEQMLELKSLRGKNMNVIEHMMKRVDAEKKSLMPV